MAALNFNAHTVEPSAPRDILPAGDYNVVIVKSEAKPTKAQTGHYLQLELEVLDGAHKGRHLFDILNLWNPNPTASEIAQRTLSAICHATGVMEVGDSTALHNIPMTAKVKVDPAKGDYEASNKISGYGKYAGPASAQSAPGGFGAPAFAAPQMAAPAFTQPAQQAAPAFAPPAPQAAFAPPAPASAPAPSFAPAPAPSLPPQAPASAPAPAAQPPQAGFQPPPPPFAQPSAPAPVAAPEAPAMAQAPVQAAAPTPPWAQG